MVENDTHDLWIMWHELYQSATTAVLPLSLSLRSIASFSSFVARVRVVIKLRQLQWLFRQFKNENSSFS